MKRFRPTYDLAEIQKKVRDGEWVITKLARDEAFKLEFDATDIKECVLDLTRADFSHSMPANRGPTSGLWQDVYNPDYDGLTLYVKLQVSAANRAVVIDFKEK